VSIKLDAAPGPASDLDVEEVPEVPVDLGHVGR
jgi:hypothetical protein